MRKESLLHWTADDGTSAVCTFSGISAGKHVFMELDTVPGPVKLFVNGSYAYFRKTAFRSFRVEITRFLCEGENTLRLETPSGSPAVRRTVLAETDPVHFDERLIHLKYVPSSRRILLEGTVWNHTKDPLPGKVAAESPLFGSVTWESSIAPGTTHFARTIPLWEFEAWSPDHPVLYPVSLSLESGEFQDSAALDWGIRSFRFESEECFLLNGSPLPLKGLSLPEEPAENDLPALKRQGINLVRISGRPPEQTFLNACDKAGLLVVEEAFSNRSTEGFASEERERNLSDMVLRDRNHPSVILWSIGEGPQDDDAAAMAQEITAMDPERPVSDGIPGK